MFVNLIIITVERGQTMNEDVKRSCCGRRNEEEKL
jgi:hypothetical protein